MPSSPLPTAVRPLLRFGSVGPTVRLLQAALNVLTSFAPKLDVDGQFGGLTLARTKQFQTSKTLTPDGIVGPKTHGVLEAGYAIVDGGGAGGEEDAIEAAATRVVMTALQSQRTVGWRDFDKLPDPLNPRIATRHRDPATKLRQGGPALLAILTAAGYPGAANALTIKDNVAAAYAKPKFDSADRALVNQQDVGSWCGVFVVAMYRLAGLNMATWPAHTTEAIGNIGSGLDGNGQPADWLYTTYANLRRGDIIQFSPSGRNHHALVNAVLHGGTGHSPHNKVYTIEGNAGIFHTIAENSYFHEGDAGPNEAFLTSTHRFKERAALLTPNWAKLLGNV